MGDRAEYIKISGWAGMRSISPLPTALADGAGTARDFSSNHLARQRLRSAHSAPEGEGLCTRWASIEKIPVVKVGQTKAPEERAILFMSRLLQPKATRHRTEKTLQSAISAHFQRQL